MWTLSTWNDSTDTWDVHEHNQDLVYITLKMLELKDQDFTVRLETSTHPTAQSLRSPTVTSEMPKEWHLENAVELYSRRTDHLSQSSG